MILPRTMAIIDNRTHRCRSPEDPAFFPLRCSHPAFLVKEAIPKPPYLNSVHPPVCERKASWRVVVRITVTSLV
jgi:hypothetical protein